MEEGEAPDAGELVADAPADEGRIYDAEQAYEGEPLEQQQGEWEGEQQAPGEPGGDDVYGDEGVLTADEIAGMDLEAEEQRELAQQGQEVLDYGEQQAAFDAEPEERPPSQRVSGILRTGEQTMRDVGGPTRTARAPGPLDRTRIRMQKHQEKVQAKQARIGCSFSLIKCSFSAENGLHSFLAF